MAMYRLTERPPIEHELAENMQREIENADSSRKECGSAAPPVAAEPTTSNADAAIESLLARAKQLSVAYDELTRDLMVYLVTHDVDQELVLTNEEMDAIAIIGEALSGQGRELFYRAIERKEWDAARVIAREHCKVDG